MSFWWKKVKGTGKNVGISQEMENMTHITVFMKHRKQHVYIVIMVTSRPDKLHQGFNVLPFNECPSFEGHLRGFRG
jgi:hypothetical protein